MVDIETLLFISKMNRLAKQTRDRKRNRFIPFSKKDKKKCMNYPEAEQQAFYYDDTDEALVCNGMRYYSLVEQMLVDSQHDDIVSLHDDVFVCIPEDKGFGPYLVAYPEEPFEGACVIIENGEWYMV